MCTMYCGYGVHGYGSHGYGTHDYGAMLVIGFIAG